MATEEEKKSASPIPLTHKAAVYTAYEEKDFSKVVKIDPAYPVPAVTKDHVLVKVVAAGVNPVDWKLIKGIAAIVQGSKFPRLIGGDLAGVVVDVAPGSKFKPGDKVYGITPVMAGGAFAEYALVPEKVFSKKPEKATFAEAASLPIAALTSLQVLQEKIGVKPGSKGLILGATTATGFFGVQIAKHLGASFVAGTCSAKNVENAKSYGFDKVIDYESQKWYEELKEEDIDWVYEAVTNPTGFADAYNFFKTKSVPYVSISGESEDNVTVGTLIAGATKSLYRGILTTFAGPKYSVILLSASDALLDSLSKIVDAGHLKSFLSYRYPLEKTVDALDFSKNGRPLGKIAIIVDEALADTY